MYVEVISTAKHKIKLIIFV